jgi:hypothetical protein
VARVPQYQQQVDVQNEPRAREQNVGSAAAFGAGVGQAVQQAGQVVNQIAAREQEKADIAALMAADRELADLELQLFHDPDAGAYSKRGRDAFGTPDQVFPTWDKTVSTIQGRLTPAQRMAFEKQAQGRRQSLETGLARHITAESDRFYAQEADATVATSAAAAAANYNDPARVALEAERAVRASMSLDDGAAPEVIKVRVMEAQSSVYAAAVERRLQDDPVGAIAYFEEVMDKLSPGQLSRMEPVIREARKTQVVFAAADAALSGGNVALTSSFDGAVEQVLATEGGYVADDAGKGETNFGINTTANPGVDIKGLSEDQAREIYKTKYWDAIDADSLPPEIRGMAFDAAVNQGVGKAKEMLREAGGDPAKFLALRRAHYEELIDKDPEKYAQYAEGWEKRVAQFEQGGMGAPPATLSQALRSPAVTNLPPDERKQAELRIRQEWQTVELARREAADARLNEGFAFIQGGGTVAGLPPALRASMEPKEIADLEQYERVRRSNGGAVETDLTRYGELLDLAVSRPLEFASMSLVPDQKNLSDADYKALVKAQASVKAGRPDALLAERKLVTEVATPVLRELGILAPVKGAPTRSQPKKGQERKYEQFTNAVQSEVSAYRQQFGRDPTVDDVQGIVDRLVIAQTVTTPTGWFGTDEEQTVYSFEAVGAPLAPRNAKVREVGKVYSTPRGPALWMGEGWALVTPTE